MILIPEEEVAVVDPPTGRPATAPVAEQNLTMTRSLGDFHAHRYGVSDAPDVRTFALADLLAARDRARDSRLSPSQQAEALASVLRNASRGELRQRHMLPAVSQRQQVRF